VKKRGKNAEPNQMEADLHDTKDGSNNTGEADSSSAWVVVTCLALLGRCRSAGGGRSAANVTGSRLAASADVFALDNVVGAGLGLEGGTRAGDIARGLDVECATVIFESGKSDAEIMSVKSFTSVRRKAYLVKLP
jgi:hypothetical protein